MPNLKAYSFYQQMESDSGKQAKVKGLGVIQDSGLSEVLFTMSTWSLLLYYTNQTTIMQQDSREVHP